MPTNTEVKTKVIMTCDNKSCTTEYSWVQEEIGEKVELIPEAVCRFIMFGNMGGPTHQKCFCSVACMRDFLKDYVPLKSPRAMREEKEAAERAVQKARTEQVVDVK